MIKTDVCFDFTDFQENHYLTRKLEELQHTTGSHRNTVQLAQNATAAMAADAETLR